MNIRAPVVAGAFYPGSEKEVDILIDSILKTESEKIDYSLADRKLIGCVVPHAGYVYSAYEAIHFFEIIRKSAVQYDTFIIINPNHTGYGENIEVDAHDAWKTPMGIVDLDKEFIENLGLPVSSQAQSQEHSAEVMLPLMQKIIPYSFRIVPICMLRQNPENARVVTEKIISANKALNRKIMIIASSDFSHFESPARGEARDDLVLQEIEAGNTEQVYETVIKNRISVCGYGPIMTLMEYAKRVAPESVSAVLARGHSGKSRPSDSVVDYITILFYQ